jgi:hypothetical protein
MPVMGIRLAKLPPAGSLSQRLAEQRIADVRFAEFDRSKWVDTGSTDSPPTPDA